MATDVGSIYLEVFADTKALKAQIRQAAKQAGKDFGKFWGDEAEKSMSPGLSRIGRRITKSMEDSGRMGAVAFADSFEKHTRDINWGFDDAIVRAAASQDWGPLLAQFSSIEKGAEGVSARLREWRKEAVELGGTGDRFTEMEAALNGYVSQLEEGERKAAAFDATHRKMSQEFERSAKFFQGASEAQAATAAKLAEHNKAWAQEQDRLNKAFDTTAKVEAKINAERDKNSAKKAAADTDALRKMQEALNKEFEKGLARKSAEDTQRLGNEHENLQRVLAKSVQSMKEFDASGKGANDAGKVRALNSEYDLLSEKLRTTLQNHKVMTAGMDKNSQAYIDAVGRQRLALRGLDDDLKALNKRKSTLKIDVDTPSSAQMSLRGMLAGKSFSTGLKKGMGDIKFGNPFKAVADQIGSGIDYVSGKWKEFAIAMPAGLQFILANLLLLIGPLSTVGSALSSVLIPLVATLYQSLVGLGAAFAGVGAAAGYAFFLAKESFDVFEEKFPETQKALDHLKNSFEKIDVPMFAKQWSNSLKDFAQVLGDSLKFDTVAENLGKATAKITDAFTGVLKSAPWTRFVDDIEGPLSNSLAGFGTGLAGVFSGLLSWIHAAAPLAEELGNMFGEWGTKLGEALGSDVGQAKLTNFMAVSTDAIMALLPIITGLGDAFGTIFLRFSDTGTGFLRTIGDLVGKFNEWLATQDGLDAMTQLVTQAKLVFDALFGGIDKDGNVVVGVFGAIGQSLATMVTPKTIEGFVGFLNAITDIAPIFGQLILAVSDVEVFEILAAALDGIGAFIKPLIGIITELSGTFGDVILGAVVAFSNVLEGLVPLLRPVGEAFNNLLTAIGPALQTVILALGPLLDALIPVFNSLINAVIPLVPVITELITIFMDAVASVLPSLIPLFDALGPVITAVAGAIGPILPVVAELVTLLANGLAEILPQLTPIFAALGPVINIVLQALMPLIPIIADIIGVMADLIAAILPPLGELFKQLAPIIAEIGGKIGDLLVKAVMLLAPILIELMPVIMALVEAFLPFVDIVFDLANTLLSALAPILLALLPIIADLAPTVIQLVIAFVPILRVIGLLGPLLDLILPPISALIVLILNLIKPILNFIEPALTFIASLVSAKGAVGDIGKALSKFIDEALNLGGKIGAFFRSIADGLGKFISGFGEAFTKVGANVTGFITKIVNFGENIVLGLLGGLEGAWVKVTLWFTGVIEGLITFVKGLFGIASPSTVFAEFGTMILQGLLDGLTTMLGAIGTFFTDLFTTVSTFVVDGITALITYFTELPGNVINAVSGLITMAGQWIGDVWANIVSIGTAAWDAYVTFWTGVPDRVIGFVSGLIEKAGQWISDVWAKIVEIGADAWAREVDFWSSLPDKVIGFVGGLIEKAGTWITDVWNNIKTIAEQRWTDFQTFWSDLPGKIISAVGSLAVKVDTWMRDVWDDMGDAVEEKWNFAKKFWGDLGQKIIDAVGSMKSKFDTWVSDLWADFSASVEDKWNFAKKFWSDLPGKIISAIGDANKVLNDVGTKIIGGLWDGLKKAWEDVKKWVGGLGDWIADHKGPESVDIRLLQPAGGWIMQGLQKGITDALPALRRTLDQVTGVINVGGSSSLGVNAARGGSNGGGGVTTIGGARTVEAGAIQIVTPVKDPAIVASMVLDGLVARAQ